MYLTTRLPTIVAAIATLAILASPSPAPAFWPWGAEHGPERWASAHTLALIDMPDIQRTRQRWGKTAAAQAWGDPATAYWRSAQLAPAIQEVLGRYGLASLGKWIALAEKRATAVVEIVPSSGLAASARMAGIVRIDFGANAPKAMETMLTDWPQLDARMARIAGRDLKIVTHARQSGLLAPCSAWVGSVCWVATSSHALEGALSRALNDDDSSNLADTASWRRARGERRDADDIFVFVNTVEARQVMAETLEGLLRLTGRGASTPRVGATFQWLGVQYLEAATVNVEMRDKGIYQRSALLTDGRPKGLLYITQGGGDLATPRWMTADAASYSAIRLVALKPWKDDLMRMFQTTFPEFAPKLANLGGRAKEFLGFEPDLALQAVGPEIATVSRPGSPMPEVAILFEIRDEDSLDEVLEALRRRAAVAPLHKSYRGHHIESFVIGSVGFYIHVAKVNGFLMVATGDAWLRSYLDTSAQLAATGRPIDKKQPMGAGSLLPMLDQPFDGQPEGDLVGRSFTNPAPGYMQMNSMLPLVVPFANMMLQQQGAPPIPEWVVATLPPLMPFAKNAFPTVERIMETRRGLVTERYSAYDPFASPLGAAAVAIGLRLGLERAATMQNALPR